MIQRTNNKEKPTSTSFSFLKWLKRGTKSTSSTESINTFYSTATVRSFAFQSGPINPPPAEPASNIFKQSSEVGPFASGASKLIHFKTHTLPPNILPCNYNLTTRYSLKSYNSYQNLPLLKTDKPRRRKVYVKGKRRAPNPPVNGEKKKRPAPPPPNTLILERGVLISNNNETMPKPWYKRNPNESKCESSISELDKEAVAIVQQEQARSRESILLKSSKIVDILEKQKTPSEQQLIQNMVTSVMENSSSRRGTRALISKFNAISNVTKVTVNTKFLSTNETNDKYFFTEEKNRSVLETSDRISFLQKQLNTNRTENLKEILKEMKYSLPKREEKGKKVSSSVQTCTSVRKLRNFQDQQPSTSGSINDDKIKVPVTERVECVEEMKQETNMNTLAINRLLRKLEGAIASGHHEQAAGLAKELSRLKISCSVVRQRSNVHKGQPIKVKMYIEDKLALQGPISLQLDLKMSIGELKIKISKEYDIPTNVQRWMINKIVANRDDTKLEEFKATNDSTIFLYVVAPELKTIIEKPYDQEKPMEKKIEQYEELISLENCDIIGNSEQTECPICFMPVEPGDGVVLKNCLHVFCKPCLADTILYCEEAEVKCPYGDAQYNCDSTLQEREIKALVVPEVYQQHLTKSMIQAETNAGNNAFHCKTLDCPGWCIYDDDVNNFLCPVCRKNNCLTCQAIHTGRNCKQYQEELKFSKDTDHESKRTAVMLEEMLDKGEALNCPTCAVVLMKKWGCDWLRCSMCKTEICWVTRGARWGPGGKGDTSGGCRCGENGIKCHPRCNYCH